jgi:DGQHR domain-containing protein
MPTYEYKAISAQQTSTNQVLSFAATASDILAFADIERVSRQHDGQLHGFQRHQIASHIREIRDYLSRDDALLPNPIVIAFIKDVQVTPLGEGLANIAIHVGDSKPGYVVDGQQRLTALSGVTKPDFQVFVSALVCRDYNELRQQFVLINNTRPLPKALIYELLPNVEGLPERFTARAFAAQLVDLLNYRQDSSLQRLVYQHTNPRGIIRDTALQKLILNSASDGAIREFVNEPDYVEKAFTLVSEFFWAVRVTFKDEWEGMTPKTSRLVHGAGIVSLGFVMELLYSRTRVLERSAYEDGLRALKRVTAWTKGIWRLSPTDERSWNAIQNTSADINILANYLVRELKRSSLTTPLNESSLVPVGV